MFTQARNETRTAGSIDARPAQFEYVENQDGLKELRWHENGMTKEGRVSNQDIIAVIPIHAHLPDDYTVLAVAPNSNGQDDKAASPVIFRSLMLTKPPPAFIHDHSPPGNACWRLRSSTAEEPNLHVVTSSGSGLGRAESVWKLLLQPMLHYMCPNKPDYKLHHTTSEHSITELTKEVFLPEANRGVIQAIILLSGDGGLVDVVNGLLAGPQSQRYEPPNIALLPLGTGNAMAHSCGITGDNTLGMRNLLQGPPQDLALFRATFSTGARQLVDEGRHEMELEMVNGTPTVYGAVVFSWGLHATLVADSDTHEYRQFGAERFQMAAKEALFPADGSHTHEYRGTVSVLRASTNTKDEWQRLNGSTHAYVMATMVSQLEKGFTISPRSKPLDGQLRLVHFGSMSGNEAMELMTKAYKGGAHVEEASVTYEEIEGLRIAFEEDEARWRRVCVDGKIIRVERGGWVEVRAGVRGVARLIVAL